MRVPPRYTLFPYTDAFPISATAGDSIADIAHLTGGTNPTGSITFTLYSDASCTTSVFTSTKTVSGNGNYTSDSYPANMAGTYHWVPRYCGDAKNNAAARNSAEERKRVDHAGN